MAIVAIFFLAALVPTLQGQVMRAPNYHKQKDPFEAKKEAFCEMFLLPLPIVVKDFKKVLFCLTTC